MTTITLIADPRCDSWDIVYAAVASGELPRVPDAVDHDREYIHCTFNDLPTTAKHTPGPWKVHRWGPNDAALEILGPSHQTLVALADVCFERDDEADTPDMRQAIANAHLIAAAPDLLAACKAILREHEAGTHDGGTPGMAALRAAIRKAGGAA